MLFFACVFPSSFVDAAVTSVDDSQRRITLNKPAQRIISLAPHATELLFAAGAGSQIVGVSDYSDYPDQAKKITSVGNIFALDLERVIALKPDLVVVWGTGNAKLLTSKLRENHVTVFESEPHDFEAIASSMERLATLTGTTAIGFAAAEKFRTRLASLRQNYKLKDTQKYISVFYQVWRKPLITLNDQHLVSQAIHLCGGKNIFGNMKEISPTISVESVLSQNPQVIIASTGEKQDVLADWLQFPGLLAVSKNNLFTVEGDWINRSGPRILDGTEVLCQRLANVRNKLK
ncbi:MAG: cobalamin-binding protein [Cytophaga sp.]|nr:cobalamin-binding protein [Undibacterium sp.]